MRSKHTPNAPRAQQSHNPDVRDLCFDPVLIRAGIERVELIRRRDPQASHLQVIWLSGRHIVDAFWSAPFELDLRNVAHEGDVKRLALIGVGRWFRPIVRRDVLAGCILPASDILRGTSAERSLLDLHALDAVADWLHSRRNRA